MAITNLGFSDPYGMSRQEYYERCKYEEMQKQIMREAKMRQQTNQFQQFQQYQQEAEIQAPQENKTLLLL